MLHVNKWEGIEKVLGGRADATLFVAKPLQHWACAGSKGRGSKAAFKRSYSLAAWSLRLLVQSLPSTSTKRPGVVVHEVPGHF